MRLDTYLVENNFFESRTKARQAIEKGIVKASNKYIFKPSYDVSNVDTISVDKCDGFVSLGGYKLDKAIKDFNFDVNNLIVADIGASTGGFTDCVLQRGAKKVYAIDLNDELLHHTLKEDDRVIEVIKNARDLSQKDFADKLDLIVADLSFISSTIILPIISRIISDKKDIILLVKPQFEVGAKKRFKNGIVRDDKLHLEILKNVINVAKEQDLHLHNITTAPYYKDKNKEFLIHLKKGVENKICIEKNLENYL